MIECEIKINIWKWYDLPYPFVERVEYSLYFKCKGQVNEDKMIVIDKGIITMKLLAL